MPRLRVNDREIEVPEGTSVLDAIFHAGYDVPYFCSERHLSPIGACRMCLVKVGAPRKGPDGDWIKDEEGRPRIFWFPKLMAACTTRVSEGMVVDTLADEVKKAQAGMVEFTLENHPLDCPTCDKGGACELQDRAYEYGLFEKYYKETQNGLKALLYSRFDFKKRAADKHHKLSEFVILDRERCIHCKRCIRYFEEVVGEEVLDFIERGNHTFVGSEEWPLPAGFSGNITDICPVGALLDLTARFRGRNWEFESTATFDPTDALWSAIWVDSRSGRLERIRAREHPEVNAIWISDAARFGHGWTKEGRVTEPLLRKNGELVPVSFAEAEEVIRGLKGAFGFYLAGDLTLEEGFAAMWAARALGGGAAFENQTPYPASGLPLSSVHDLLNSDFALVVGDPAEEMPVLYLWLQDFLKGLAPAPRYQHGTPIADLRREERMKRRPERLATFAPYPTRLFKYAGVKGVYAPGSAGALIEALAAAMDGRRPPEVPGVLPEAVAEAARRFLAAKSRTIVVGAEVLWDPEAAERVAAIARGKGAHVIPMPPAANAVGLELIGLSEEKGPEGAEVLVALGTRPPKAIAEAAGFRLYFLSNLDEEATREADLVLPFKTAYEKRGLVVNAEGRVLELAPAPTAPLHAQDGVEAAAFLLSLRGKKPPARGVVEARTRLHERLKVPLEVPEEGTLFRPRRRVRTSSAPGQGGLFLRPVMWREAMRKDPRVRAALGERRLFVHPAEAERRGLARGERVVVKTPYGEVPAVVVLDEGLAEGAVMLEAYGRGTGRLVDFRLGGEA